MATIVKCPHCGNPVEISAAIKSQIEDQVIAVERAKFQQEITRTRLEVEKNTQDKVRKEMSVAIENAQKDGLEREKQVSDLQKQLLGMSDLMRQLKREKQQVEIEAQKKLLQEEEKIRIEERKNADEKNLMKILEMQKQLSDALKANEDLRRKLQQGSQQTQGEVLELEFENSLKKAFPDDLVKPVPKGIRGADIVQEVRNSHGRTCGVIIWEMKNTKNWTDGWVTKLKEDQRAIKADVAVLVSAVLPKEINNFGLYHGIWVTGQSYLIGLATALRINLEQIFSTKLSTIGKNEKMEIMFSYLTGPEFTQRVEGIVEAFSAMQEDVEREKRWFSVKWAKQEKNIRRVIDQTHGMYGDLQSIVGKALPQIKNLELTSGEVSCTDNT